MFVTVNKKVWNENLKENYDSSSGLCVNEEWENCYNYFRFSLIKRVRYDKTWRIEGECDSSRYDENPVMLSFYFLTYAHFLTFLFVFWNRNIGNDSMIRNDPRGITGRINSSASSDPMWGGPPPQQPPGPGPHHHVTPTGPPPGPPAQASKMVPPGPAGGTFVYQLLMQVC